MQQDVCNVFCSAVQSIPFLVFIDDDSCYFITAAGGTGNIFISFVLVVLCAL